MTGLTKNQFAILSSLAPGLSGAASGQESCALKTQRELAEQCDMSLGSVNSALKELRDFGYIDQNQKPTDAGIQALAPYKVENAVIMAAGMSSRFAPISYERPKGTLQVRGEVLIERQIKQLKEAGINDITVVVGYMKEQFFYLEDKYGVDIVINEVYADRNNHSSLMLVSSKLGNTFICSSDNYFTENVFEPYVYKAYYSANFFPGKTKEYIMETGPGQRIVSVEVGGEDGYGMLGHVYFDRDFSNHFVDILKAEYDKPETIDKLWEDLYRDHVSEFDMVMRPYDPGVIFEFDSLDELREFDPDFIDNIDSSILDNIERVLDVPRSAITAITPINQGLTNLSCKFSAGGLDYVYRHPGVGTDSIIDRAGEAKAQKIAAELGLDDTFIYEEPEEGWKISRFITNAQELDYHNKEHVAKAIAMARVLHGSGKTIDASFNIREKTEELISLLGQNHRNSFPDFSALNEFTTTLADYVESRAGDPVLCHNDFYSPNILISGDSINLIDWEYSGMSDYASDLGVFICCSDYTIEEAKAVLEEYFQRPLTAEEEIHCMAYVAIVSFHWFVWALYKDSCGAPVGEWLYLWYKYTKSYGRHAVKLIQDNGGSIKCPLP